MVVFRGKFILFYSIKNLKCKFYYEMSNQEKKFDIINIKKINEAEIEEDNKSPNTPGCHITADGLINEKDGNIIIIFKLKYIFKFCIG